MEYDVAVIGGGSAGMAAAVGAKRAGAKRVVIIDRDNELGGILNQCTHRGFGTMRFGEELTGAQYAGRFRALVRAEAIRVLTCTAVLRITRSQELLLSGRERGLTSIAAGAVVLASGCREKPIGALPVTGTRPSGIFTAGAAQRLLNLGGYAIGRRAVVLGSGDVGMIVARELKRRGAEVVCVLEQNERCGGLARNRLACLDAYGIPLILRSTADEIHGAGRISGVTARSLDTGARRLIPCDTLIVSVGLIPERELLENLSPVPDFLFVCGNACFVHELADEVTMESERSGALAAGYASGRAPDMAAQSARRESGSAAGELICTACPKGCAIIAAPDGYAGMACGRTSPEVASGK